MTPEYHSALALIGLLDTSFPGTQSLIVGGAVRDKLLNIPAKDVDIATNIPFDRLESSLFQMTDITKNTVNAQPVSIISHGGFSYEIAAFRVDSQEADGRSNNVATVTRYFEDDSLRRDITINAMGIGANEEIVDHHGGKRDLHDRIVRAVGDPNNRFREDATRILRVFRFAAKLDFRVDHETSRAAVANKYRLLNRDEIAPESIAKEFYKAAECGGPAFARFIQLLDDATILEDILPEFTAMRGFMHDPKFHPEGGSTVIGHILECLRVSPSKDPVVILGILFHDLGKAVTRGIKENGHSSYYGHEEEGVPIVQAIFDRLRFNDLTSHDKEHILFAVGRHMLIHKLSELSARTLTKLVLDPGWEVIKAVGFADEFSRGADVHSTFESFTDKIVAAEARVAKIAANADDLRLRVKEYVDGHRVQVWFPETKADPKLLKPVLGQTAEYILELLDKGITPTEGKIRAKISEILWNL